MKTNKLRIFTKRFFLYLNVAVVFFFLLACLVPYLNPQRWWFISFLGLAFPFLLVAVLFFMIGWLVILKPRFALISGIPLLISFKSIGVFFAFHRPELFEYKKESNSIRVATWNVARFIELKRNNNSGSQVRLKMLEQIKKQDADILCLQEFHTSIDTSYYNNIKAVKELGYPYFYFSFDEDGDKHYYSSIIFSRFPVIDSGLVRYPRPTLPDALIHADILVNKDTIRVYTTHLQSLQFSKNDYRSLHEIKNVDDSLLSNSRTIFSKLKRGVSYRSIQAGIIKDVLANSPHPVIFCADLNDVPNSYAYFTVRNGMQDAFLKKGFGIGRTFSGISPTLRIDYIFADDQFRIKQFGRIVKKLSDHYMLLADVELKK
ncbi:MAG TPA: endonuclease/exonuclease/phosphatase family protein [Chitinophagaceae bacterium]|nr:endonuclease/exonuclease/phosphatase family protein [Chitinophagaceae bacterium]